MKKILFLIIVFPIVSLVRAQDITGQHGLVVAPSFSFQQYFGQSVNLSTGAKASAFLGLDQIEDKDTFITTDSKGAPQTQVKTLDNPWGFRLGLLVGGGSIGTSVQTEAERLLLPSDVSFVITPYWFIKFDHFQDTKKGNYLGFLLSIDGMASTLENFQTKTFYTPGTIGEIAGIFFQNASTVKTDSVKPAYGGWGLGIRIRSTQNLWNGRNLENLFSVSNLDTYDLSEYLEFTFPESKPNPTTVKLQCFEYLGGQIGNVATGPVVNLEISQSFDLITPAEAVY